jgi:hypothetical protein
MNSNNFTKQLQHSALYALLASVLMVTLMLSSFLLFEPKVGIAQVDSETFQIRQTIIDETSFDVRPANAVMDSTLNGVTGGTSNGSSTFVVVSSNPSGYRVDIEYAYDMPLQTQAMYGTSTGAQTIYDYWFSSSTVSAGASWDATYNFNTAPATTGAQFAYTIDSDDDDTSTAAAFLDNGSVCGGAGTNDGPDNCWMAPTSSAVTVVDRSQSALTGATSTIYFRVVVPAGAQPAVEADYYVATATLSLFVNP